ncbi:MAG: Transposase mutator type [candidate division TA06 bacterium 32_111]|uniref:Mutator family transposase n=2 Tax=Bacteria candidate phyla TaxID=1783234 RepID=A0A101I3F6_UNCT6|nr:MAG: Transposase mutator type [candidate division TA06 bacterium 32_111]KUK88066.1 MAG: Transposase mutator type [candidate division TA06 bacterium 34_109]HAF06997.1 IS256 family transposase [candidate division WOR-3 bacterium]HCP16911.1 IS256 family transposase [candidate division WOR-3 bacterium]
MIEFKSIKRYQRKAEDVDRMVLEMFLAGVSTRRVKEVLEPILGEEEISATTVSKISKILDDMVFKFHNRRLKDEYEYLILDGLYLNAKSPVYKRRRCILVCYGIKENGKKELVDFYLTKKGESQESWEHFLNILYHRGLEGKNLVLAVIDGNRGLDNAVRFIYPLIKIQRCWVHKLRNVANKCPRKLQEEVIRGAREIYSAEGKNKALQAYKAWQDRWRDIVPDAVECLERDLEELLTFYSLPEGYWKKLRTTNIIERVFREVRRRARPMS